MSSPLFWGNGSDLFWNSDGSRLFWRNPVSQSLVALYEYGGPVSQDLVVAWENISPRRSKSLVAPWESRGMVSASKALPWESGQGISQDSVIPYEILAGVSGSLQAPYEWTLILAVSAITGWESRGPVSSSRGVPWESGQGVSQSLAVLYEILQGLTRSQQTPYEFSQPVNNSLAIPFEVWGPLTAYPSLPMPAGIKAVRFILLTNTQNFGSPETGAVQTIEKPGARWMVTYQYPSMERADAAAVIAFLRNLRGSAGRFYGGDPSAATPLGAGGSPWVDGEGQTGIKLNTKNWTPSTADVLKAGDFIAWDTPTRWRELHQVTADVSSDAAGKATIEITPQIREASVDSAVLILNAPTCVMMLLDDEQAAWDGGVPDLYDITFTALEVFYSG
ncbi:MAG: hypothetical protein NOU37_09300 [Candidatus Brocadiales bacterium]|nr:hypothetical protein [Candidatus Bathyanammoxibius amoris]